MRVTRCKVHGVLPLASRKPNGQCRLCVRQKQAALKEERRERYRKSHLEQGLCIRCARPATTTLHCDKHRIKRNARRRRTVGRVDIRAGYAPPLPVNGLLDTGNGFKSDVQGADYRLLSLGHGRWAIVEAADFERAAGLGNWNWLIGKNHRARGYSGYAYRSQSGVNLVLHRLLFDAPPGIQVDHVDRKRLELPAAQSASG